MVIDFTFTSKLNNNNMLKNIKTVIIPKYKTNKQKSISKDNPLYYCSYCEKIMNYSDLKKGCRCRICDNDLFLILWEEYKKSISKSLKNKQIFLII